MSGTSRVRRQGSEPNGGMMGRAERNRQAILEAAVRLLVEDPGVSMQRIAEAAGVGRTTVHRFFPSREDLIRAIWAQALEEAEAAMDSARPEEGSIEEALERLARALVPIGERFRFLMQESYYPAQVGESSDVEDTFSAEAEERLTVPLRALVERGRRDGAFRLEIPSAWIVSVFWALVFAAWEDIQAGRIAPLDAPRLVKTTVLRGLGSGDSEGDWKG